MMRSLIVPALFVALLTACTPYIPAWTFYDQCTQSQSFTAMAGCGRVNINSYCSLHNNCSANDNSFVLYTDSLVISVKNGELTEAEAQRKWIEFRMAQVNARQQQIQSAPRPISCYNMGSMINCY